MKQVVHVRATDAETGASLPCRLLIRDNDGQVCVPLGYLPDPSVGEGHEVGGHLVEDGNVWAYVDGACEVRLPPGQVFIEARRGPMYAPLCAVEDRGLGRIAIRLQLQQVIKPGTGWYWADTRAHWLTPPAAALEGGAEGLDLVHVLAARWDRSGLARIANLLDFSGQQVLLERHGCQVVVNTYQRGGVWGDLALLHCHRIVFPLVSGEPGFEHYTLGDWCYQCHRKGGLVVWSDFPGRMGERLLLALLGDIDTIEWSGETFVSSKPLSAKSSGQCPGTELSGCQNNAPSEQWIAGTNAEGLALWYALLNLGRRMSIVGASGKCSNATPLGAVRTATFLGAEPLTPSAWIAAVKRGQTYATRGPVLEWQINGQENIWNWPDRSSEGAQRHHQEPQELRSGQLPGQHRHLSRQEVLHLHVRACSVLPFTRLELVCAGQVIESVSAGEKTVARVDLQRKNTRNSQSYSDSSFRTWQAELTWQIRAEKLADLPGNWFALRCWHEDCLVVHSSALWLPTAQHLNATDRELLEHALNESEAVIRNTTHPRREALLERLNKARILVRSSDCNRSQNLRG